jgi:2-polyprenyl-3-methyl-5-hydroxy-6-metoxy-1,4-benzoquinol methylase/3-polyprenyl-4-hydroxybenzoate decarboxylase
VSERLTRSQRAAVAETGEYLLLIARDGTVRRLDGDSADLAREALAFFARPHDEAELIAHIEKLAGPLGERRSVVRELVMLLRDVGAIEAARDAEPRAGVNVVVAISGAIAASHAPMLVHALQRRGHAVEVALTPTAARFVSVETLAALTQREPQTSLWPRAAHVPVPHVALARWADLVIVYPASATTIARIANGDFSDLVSAIALTTRGAVVIAPSMNIDMLETPSVQRNLDKLRDDGFTILHGVTSVEVADAPSSRTSVGGSAPPTAEVAATLDALRRAGVLRRRDRERNSAGAWEAAYRQQLVPWAVDACDADIALALAEHAPPRDSAGAPRRLLDVGCGLGQIARHAVDAGYRVVATDIAETALASARVAAGARDILWLRDDICATALLGPFDAIVDRATLHALPPVRAQAWAAAMRKLTAPGGTIIVKANRDGIPDVTIGYTATDIAALLPDFAVITERDGELPGIMDDKPVPSTLVVLRRR